jgi:hypothetical protein
VPRPNSNSVTSALETWSSIGRVTEPHSNYLDPINPFSKPQYYTYKLIETLLPKAMIDLKKGHHLKMIEL